MLKAADIGAVMTTEDYDELAEMAAATVNHLVKQRDDAIRMLSLAVKAAGEVRIPMEWVISEPEITIEKTRFDYNDELILRVVPRA